MVHQQTNCETFEDGFVESFESRELLCAKNPKLLSHQCLKNKIVQQPRLLKARIRKPYQTSTPQSDRMQSALISDGPLQPSRALHHNSHNASQFLHIDERTYCVLRHPRR